MELWSLRLRIDSSRSYEAIQIGFLDVVSIVKNVIPESDMSELLDNM
jgi:hypothetical protein